MVIPKPANETVRLAQVRKLSLSREPEPSFDSLTQLLARLSTRPIAQLNVVDDEVVWSKSRIGIRQQEFPRARTFCAHTILRNEPLVVADAREDPRFSNPDTVSPQVRAYTGSPLVLQDGSAVGTLCVMSRGPFQPRADFLETLHALAQQAARQLELRLRIQVHEEASPLWFARALVEQTAHGIVISDKHGWVQLINDAAARQFGHSVRSMDLDELSRAFGFLEGPKKGPSPLNCPLRRALAGEYLGDFSAWIRRPDGTERLLTGSATPVRVGGEIVGAVMITRDQTGRFEAQEELHRAVRARERMVGIVAHDVRTPLSAVLTGARVLAQKSTLGERERRVAARMLGSGEKIARLLDDLVEFSRSQAGAPLPVRRRQVDSHRLCAKALEEVATVNPHRRFELKAMGDPLVTCDPDRASQAIINLLNNAVEHGAAGQPIRLTSRSGPQGWMVEVWNDGPPIPRNTLPHLFDAFVRGDKDHRPHTKSTHLGLGLFIVNQIVRAHGGQVEVESAAGKGTTFRLVFPQPAVRDERTVH